MVTAQLTPAGVGIHRVLIATDFSRYSNTALDFGLQVAKAYQAMAFVVSVIPADAFMLAGPEAYVAARDAAARDLLELKAELKRQRSYTEGADYLLYLLEGEVTQAILAFAHEQRADLIVIGTHGRGTLGKALMGSVAERVFRRSPVPVLTLGPHLCETTLTGTLKNILVATDFSPASERAVRYAASLARERDATLTVLHVMSQKAADGTAEYAAAAQAARIRLAESLGDDAEGSSYTLRVKEGPVVPIILDVAHEISADLLVMGVRPPFGVLERLMWPHAYELVRESSCPVLTVREEI